MNVLILGYGYCGYYLAQKLVAEKCRVTTVSRSLKEAYRLKGVIHRKGDFTARLEIDEAFDCIYYLAPPSNKGRTDERLRQCLDINPLHTRALVYFGSSGVYGDHQGNWVDENATCHVLYDRQVRRLEAENQLTLLSKKTGINVLQLRVGGIYGATRLPISDVISRKPVIDPVEAPYSNLIYVKDLVNIAFALSVQIDGCDCVNISDGHPRKMGALKQVTAQALGLAALPVISKVERLSSSSEIMKMFLNSSKRLSIEKLKAYIPGYTLSSLEEGVALSLVDEGIGT